MRFSFLSGLGMILLGSESLAFTPIVGRTSGGSMSPKSFHKHSPAFITHGSSLPTLSMADDDDGPGPLVQVGILLIMILFLGTGLLPLMDGGGRDLSIADSVVTQQDIPGKLQNNIESNQDRLSRATIQEKLSGIPVFYLTDSNGSMGANIYIAYEDAKVAADETGGTIVKATSLDQVM